MTINEFLGHIAEIEALNPKYKLGHSGDDGYCDCIGLIIGALERGGIKWPGIHGTNWTIRNMMQDVTKVIGTADFAPGMLVFKSREPGEKGYALPDRYDDDPDQRDYYHVGVVRSALHTRIVHCTSPGGMKEDTRLGAWAWVGRLKGVDYEVDEKPVEDAPAIGSAVVTAQSGGTVNMRSKPSRESDIITRVPIGSEVEVVSNDGEWARIRNPVEGYMMSQYLEEGGVG